MEDNPLCDLNWRTRKVGRKEKVECIRDEFSHLSCIVLARGDPYLPEFSFSMDQCPLPVAMSPVFCSKLPRFRGLNCVLSQSSRRQTKCLDSGSSEGVCRTALFFEAQERLCPFLAQLLEVPCLRSLVASSLIFKANSVTLNLSHAVLFLWFSILPPPSTCQTLMAALNLPR